MPQQLTLSPRQVLTDEIGAWLRGGFDLPPMAGGDGVAVTPGVGSTIATDTVSGQEYQKVKIDVGADGSSDPVSGALPIKHAITGIADGRKVVTTAGTRVALAGSTVCREVIVTAETDNTGIIVVGNASTVIAALGTRVGTPLNAGDSMGIEIDNLADVGLDSTVSGDGVTFTYLT